MARVDRVRHPQTRLLLCRASRQRRHGEYAAAVRSAAAAFVILATSYPEAFVEIPVASAPAVLRAQGLLAGVTPGDVLCDSAFVPNGVSPRDAADCLEFVLALALELRA